MTVIPAANGLDHSHLHNGAGGLISHDTEDLNLDEATNANGPNGDPEAIGYEVPNVPMGTKRRVRVVTIGGGPSGINMAFQIWQHMENVEHIVYEKSPELGGTWYDNRYPGCACDVPSHAYQFSFHPNTNWSHFYSSSKEICEYMNDVVDTYGLRDQFKVSHEVVGARWDDLGSQWVVRVKGPDGRELEDRCDFLVNGSGILNNWKWPDIKGIHDFKGRLMHTARWDEEYDFNRRRIATIGVGSSAVQAIPQLRKDVEHMTCFIRSGAWITAAGVAQQFAQGEANHKYTDGEKRAWAANPDDFLKYRKALEEEINKRFLLYVKNSDLSRDTTEMSRQQMVDKLAKKPELANVLVPKFQLGCRRLTPGNGFLESLCEDNVSVVTTGIDHITDKGVVTKDGVLHEVDTIVCATGFDVSLLPRFPFIGRNGSDLKKRWTEGPVEAYMSLMVAEYPNYFTFLGPASPVAHGSLTQAIERSSVWMLKCIAKMQAEGIRSIAPKAERVRQLNIHKNAMLPTMAWSSSCSSWYKNGQADGPVIAIHPGSKLHFFEMIKQPRFEDMEIEYDGNPFSYLGNGLSLLELEEGTDRSWFVTTPFDVNLPWSRPRKPSKPVMPVRPPCETERIA